MLAVIIPFVFMLCFLYGFIPVLGTLVLLYFALHVLATDPILLLCYIGVCVLLAMVLRIPKKVAHGKTLSV